MLAVWAALSGRLISRESRDMALFLLMCLGGYFRLGELIEVKNEDMIRPTAGGLRCWSVLLFPEERRVSSKAGEFNDTVVLDSPRFRFLDTDIAEQMKTQGEMH